MERFHIHYPFDFPDFGRGFFVFDCKYATIRFSGSLPCGCLIDARLQCACCPGFGLRLIRVRSRVRVTDGPPFFTLGQIH